MNATFIHGITFLPKRRANVRLASTTVSLVDNDVSKLAYDLSCNFEVLDLLFSNFSKKRNPIISLQYMVQICCGSESMAQTSRTGRGKVQIEMQERQSKCKQSSPPAITALLSTYIWEGESMIPRTRVNIGTVKRGTAAATAERTKVFAAKAEALYIRYVSTI